MTPREFVKLVEETTYKPGWRMGAMLDGPRRAVAVRVSYETADVRDPKKRIPLLAEQLLTWDELELMEPEYVLRWLEEMLHSMELHELHEWLRIGGQRVGVPHDGA